MKKLISFTAICLACWCACTATAGSRDGSQPIPKIIGTDDMGGAPSLTQPTILLPPPSPDVPLVSIIGPAIEASYPFGTPVNFSASFTDDGGTHTAVWTFEGQSVTGNVNVATGEVTGSWNFSTPGYHFVTLTITDQAGNSVSVTTVVVVFDRGDGFLNGKGRFNSPAGALVSNPQAAGRVDFEFDIRYRKDDLVPTGSTWFKFNVGNMEFASAGCDWFMVGFARGMYRGIGTINGTGSYKFLVSGMDGDDPNPVVVDKIRLKITDMSGVVVYDNQMGSPDTAMATCPITSGFIEARLPNGGLGHLSSFRPSIEPAAGPARGFDLAQNFPNPFRASTQVRFSLPQRSHVKLSVFDVAGREVATLAKGAWDSGVHTVSWTGRTDGGDMARGGVYFVRMASGLGSGEQSFVSVKRMIVLD